MTQYIRTKRIRIKMLHIFFRNSFALSAMMFISIGIFYGIASVAPVHFVAHTQGIKLRMTEAQRVQYDLEREYASLIRDFSRIEGIEYSDSEGKDTIVVSIREKELALQE